MRCGKNPPTYIHTPTSTIVSKGSKVQGHLFRLKSLAVSTQILTYVVDMCP